MSHAKNEQQQPKKAGVRMRSHDCNIGNIWRQTNIQKTFHCSGNDQSKYQSKFTTKSGLQ